MTDDRQERLAKNEAVFRLLNENILALAGTLGGDEPFDFVCECARTECFERIRMTRDEYELVRADGSHFLVVKGHEDPAIEHVVETHDEYAVVKKDGAAGALARTEDPRG